MNRRGILVLSATMLVLALAAGCAATKPVPTEALAVATSPDESPATATKPVPKEGYTVATSADEILGTWTNPSLSTHRFNVDGTFSTAISPEKIDAPFATLKFWFEGAVMKIQEMSVNGVPSCGSNIGEYEVRMLADGSMLLAAKSDPCTARQDSTVGTYRRVP